MTLIRTLKRVIRSPKPNQRRNESSKTKIASVAQTPENVMAMASANDGQLKKTANIATDINKLNEKERSPSNNNNTSKNNSSQPSKTSSTAGAGTLTNSAAVEKNVQTQSNRKRKTSPEDEEIGRASCRERV